jgi:DNA-binding NarL/FixJ family response regulator
MSQALTTTTTPVMVSVPTLKIVIADDHHIFSQGLAMVLKDYSSHPIEISTTVDRGDKVIQALRRYRPQLLLMDMNMPGKDGLDVLKEIKGQFRDLKIIILTTYCDQNLAKEVLNEGASGYILKSCEAKTIIQGIEEVLDNGIYVSDEVNSGFSVQRESKVETRFTDRFISKHTLTKREVEILRMIAKAKNNKEIGSELFISDQTVSVHRKNLMRKLNVNNTAALLKIAYEMDIV